jgi:hypothetical protein
LAFWRLAEICDDVMTKTSDENENEKKNDDVMKMLMSRCLGEDAKVSCCCCCCCDGGGDDCCDGAVCRACGDV